VNKPVRTGAEVEILPGPLLEFLPECGSTQHDFDVVPVPDGIATHIYCRHCGSVRSLFEAKDLPGNAAR
jgi:hypothetical protein